MPTRNLKEILHSLPIPVEFAGFQSDTYRLSQCGWDLSMEQLHSPYRAGMEMRLAMRHESAHLYAVSDRVNVTYGEIYAGARSNHDMARMLANHCFRILCVAPSVKFRIIPVMEAFHFEPIDARITERAEEIDIESFKFFKTAKPDLKDIIITNEMVPEVLGMILKAQSGVQKEIRKREASRRNLQAYGELAAPARSIRAQIITLD